MRRWIDGHDGKTYTYPLVARSPHIELMPAIRLVLVGVVIGMFTMAAAMNWLLDNKHVMIVPQPGTNGAKSHNLWK